MGIETKIGMHICGKLFSKDLFPFKLGLIRSQREIPWFSGWGVLFSLDAVEMKLQTGAGKSMAVSAGVGMKGNN